MARPSSTGGKTSEAKTRKASSAKGGTPKTRSQKAPSKSKKASRTKSSITDLKEQIERQARELEQARQQQAASSEVLQIISASAGAIKPVFEAIVKSAVDLCQARFGAVFRMEGDLLHLVADHNFGATQRQLLEAEYPVTLSRGRVSGRSILTRSTVQIPDTDADKDYTGGNAKQSGFRSLLAAPLLKGDQAIGSIVIYKAEPGTFPPQQMAVLQNFAAQAVIAIENSRLFNEVQARTEDLSEALQQQTATGEVLRVIASSPTDVEPALQVICECACRFCNAYDSGLLLKIGDDLHFSAHYGPIRTGHEPRPISRQWVVGRSVVDKVPVQVSDFQSLEAAEFPEGQRQSREQGHRCTLSVPLLREGEAIGAIALRRLEPVAFSEKQVALLHTFADQAVIAIENARLFNETQEALERQTATADILKVIASSPDDVQPVFEAIVQTGLSLFPSSAVMLVLADDGIVRPAAIAENDPKLAEMLKRAFPVPLTRDFMHTVAILDGRLVDIPDAESGPAEFPAGRSAFLSTGHRAITIMPMMRGDQSIGALSVVRRLPGSLSDRQLELLKTFADQAVIAIENTRLLKELRERTDDLSESLQQQTATADVLKVISRSAFDLETVLDALLSSACRLCEADIGTIRYKEGGEFRLAATFGCPPEWIEHFRRYSTKPDRSSVFGRTIAEGHIVHIPDLLADPDYKRPEAQKLMGFKAALGVPLAREGEAFGVINLFRFNVSSFEDRQIELVQTFADQAVIAIENVRLFEEVQAKTRDLSEALTYQTGSANILNVIASSPTDIEPVLNAIVEGACELCEANDAAVLLKDGEHLRFRAHHGPIDINLEKWPITRGWTAGRAFFDGKPVHLRDTQSEEAKEFPDSRALAAPPYTNFSVRTVLSVPLLRERERVGAILLRRIEMRPFSDKQIALLQTFADQAVIAINNARLFDEVQAKTRDLSESLQQQTATADVLKMISRSVFDLQPVLDGIARVASDLCAANDVTILIRDGDNLRITAHHGSIPMELGTVRPINRDWVSGRAVADRRPVHVRDLAAADDYPLGRQVAAKYGHRTTLAIPLMRNDETAGCILLRRLIVDDFTDEQIALLQTFADQAVIAIENVRLFNETKEALERQTATADILKVIASSPSDVRPVFDAIARRANTLIGGFSSTVFRFIDGIAYLEAFTPTTPAADEVLKATFPRPVADYAPFRMAQAGEVAQIADTEASTYQLQNISRARGYRSMLYAPLLSDGMSIGFIAVTRVQPGTFPDHHVQLLRTFADQAVIAISNVELFQEVQNRTKELSEALQFQTAGSDVLRVISRSPDKLQPVLDAIVETSRELCGSDASTIFLFRDGKFYFAAIAGEVPRHLENLRANPMNIDEPGSVLGRLIQQKRTFHYANIMDDPELSRGRGALGGPRALLIAPLMNQGEVIGAIVLRQSHLKPFTERQIQAIEVFADQAVIAISNVGLFEQVQAKTRDLTEALEQQTATSEVLEVISSSPGELQPVFQRMLENATRICGANFGTMNLYENGAFRPVAFYNVPQAYAEKYADTLIRPHPQGPLGTVARTHEVVHVEDTKSLPVYIEGNPAIVAISDLAGARTIVIVPMLRENELIGTIAIYRQEVRPFSEKQISLLTNFAKQAVIAIENTRLLKELRQRTGDLSQSLDDLRSAQDRLVQTEKLASLGQLTAGIAHEIKNPLNFVNNFSALSAELTDELNDVLKPVAMDGKVRGEVDELTGLLKDNLEKVVQHGKRADSIVKNMLLHSREGSREHRPADINLLLDESLNLAYHGARAEKGEFNITLQRDFDADAGAIELFPQEITRAFLNLIANGVYAATRRKNEGKEPGFEPTLRATTKNLGTTVEIRIRDNGTGIPTEVREKMFNPFFTTKPAGEGTGLGLSMTHDIIVKQHGGRIDVATEPGQFTEFTIILPRNLSGRDRGET